MVLQNPKVPKYHGEFITTSKPEILRKNCSFTTQKNQMKKKKTAYQKGPHLGHRRLLAADRRSPGRELVCAH
jgi:hypothetical protein